MQYRYAITGLRCGACVEKTQRLLQNVRGVEAVTVVLNEARVYITSRTPLLQSELQASLLGTDFVLREESSGLSAYFAPLRRFISRFAPLITMFALVGLFVVVRSVYGMSQSVMGDFMAGFFLVFGSLKVVNITSFVRSYRAYDHMAMRFTWWGYVYPFLEVTLGLLFLNHYYVTEASVITMLVMLQKAYSVRQSLLQGIAPQCACLGGFFSIPITWVTFAEDMLMALMALAMIMYE